MNLVLNFLTCRWCCLTCTLAGCNHQLNDAVKQGVVLRVSILDLAAGVVTVVVTHVVNIQLPAKPNGRT